MEVFVSLSAWDGWGQHQLVGGASLEMRSGRKTKYLDIPLKDSIKGWRVLHERRLELAFEGERWFDLCRNNKVEQYLNGIDNRDLR